jgi:competence ComEA-like helix-hairpin-helix protein
MIWHLSSRNFRRPYSFRASAHISLRNSVAALPVFLLLFLALPAHAGNKQPPAHPIDINTATVGELEQLPGVGPTTANAIVQFRTRSGRFRRIDDLLAVRGISEGKLKKMRPYITIGPPPR